MRDDDVRAAMFAALDVLRARCGPDIPWDELAPGFNFRGRRVPFLNRGYGIHRARVQRGSAALSINSSFRQQRYQDEDTPDGVLYAYQDGPVDDHYNRWLRGAWELQVPLAYFIGTRPGWYRPEYPAFVAEDDPAARRVLVTFGRMRGPYDEREPVPITDEIERRYVVRQVRQRIHQTQFRGAVIPAYLDRCAICSLREVRLLDAAHIVADAEERGAHRVANGLSLCTIHHRACDQDLIGVAPDRRVHVARRLREEEDGPMLDVLKGAHGAVISVPERNRLPPTASTSPCDSPVSGGGLRSGAGSSTPPRDPRPVRGPPIRCRGCLRRPIIGTGRNASSPAAPASSGARSPTRWPGAGPARPWSTGPGPGRRPRGRI